MDFTIIKTPSVASFVKNMIPYKLHTAGYEVQQGQQEIIEIDSLTFRPANNQAAIFTQLTESTTLLFKTAPSNNPLELASYETAYTDNDWRAILGANLKSLSFLTDYWIIDVPELLSGNYTITLTSKENVEMAASFSTYTTGVTITAGVDREVREGLRIIFHVFINNDKIELSLPVQDDGTAVFYLQAILEAYLYENNNAINLPAINAVLGVNHSALTQLFTVQFADYYDGETYKFTSEGVCASEYYATTGGTSKKVNQNDVMAFQGPNTGVHSLYTLLTHQPKANKALSIYEPEILTFISLYTDSIGAVINCRNAATGAITSYNVGILVTPEKYTKFSVSVGVQNIFPAAALALLDTYDQYEVEIYRTSYTTNNIVFANTYKIECHQPLNKYFVFENSVGGLDCIKLQGETTQSLKSSSTTSGRILAHDYNPEHGDAYKHSVENQEKFKIKTKYFHNEDYLQYLRELTYTTFMQEVVYDNANSPSVDDAKYIAIDTDNSTFDVREEREGAHRIQFSYYYLFTENSY